MKGKKAKNIRRAVRREVRRADVESNKPRWMPKSLWVKFVKRVSLAFKPQTLNERSESMNNKGQVRIPIPNIGAGQQQQFDVSDAVQRKCARCEGEHFDLVVRLAVISKMSPKNRTGQDVLIKFECYLCRSCGAEFGKPTPVNQ